MAVNHRDVIYLDHAAATPLRPEVDAAMREAAAVAYANPSSPHGAGRRARRLLDDCRERVLALLGGRPTGVGRDRLIFTGGATEANVLGLVGRAGRPGGLLLHSARDHGSVAAANATLVGRGWSAHPVPLRTDGRLDLGDGLPAMSGGDVLLATTLVCGQTGIVEDMAAVAAAAARVPGLSVHVDATQAVAYEDVDLARLPAATLTVAPHKFGGPRGIGALVVRGDVALVPVVPGPQEAGLRGGTEAVVLAAGFATALALAVAERRREAARVAGLRTRLEEVARAAAAAAGLQTVVVGAAVRRAPHIATIAFPGIDRQALVMAADLEGVCCATGTACASGSSEPAPALVAAGLPEALLNAAVRLSLGRETGVEDVEGAGARLHRVFQRIVSAGGDRRAGNTG